jgi:hypothetical protein
LEARRDAVRRVMQSELPSLPWPKLTGTVNDFNRPRKYRDSSSTARSRTGCRPGEAIRDNVTPGPGPGSCSLPCGCRVFPRQSIAA